MQAALDVAQQQLALNPKDSRAQYDLYAACDVFASSAEDDQDPRIPLDAKTREASAETALHLRLHAITLLEGLLKSGLTDEYYRLNLMESQAALAGTERAQHKTQEAIALEESYIPALQKMTSEKNLLSDASSELGKAMATASGPLRNTEAAVKYASEAVEMSHHQDVQVLLILSDAYRANDDIDKCHTTTREALGLMAPLKPGQSPTRFHKLLGYELNH